MRLIPVRLGSCTHLLLAILVVIGGQPHPMQVTHQGVGGLVVSAEDIVSMPKPALARTVVMTCEYRPGRNISLVS